MSLPTLHTRLLPRKIVSASWPPTAAQILDAFYDAITGSVYRDGSARTLGVGSAVKNVVKVQESGTTVAVYGEFATTTAINAKWILAGRATVPSPAPVLATGEVFQNNEIYIGLVKDATGVFSGWNESPPWVGSLFAGYARLTGAPGTATPRPMTTRINQIDVWESEETLLVGGVGIQSLSNLAGQYFFAFTGALWEPFPASLGEADGRLWGVSTSPSGSVDLGRGSSSGVFPNGDTAAGLVCRQFAYNVGLATVTTLVRENIMRGAQGWPLFMSQNPNSGLAYNHLYVKNLTGSAFRGTMRNVAILQDGLNGNGHIQAIYDTDGATLLATGFCAKNDSATNGMLWMKW